MYDIATHAAVELSADKLVVMSTEDLQARRPRAPPPLRGRPGFRRPRLLPHSHHRRDADAWSWCAASSSGAR